jgi:two-component system response regulator FixJ
MSRYFGILQDHNMTEFSPIYVIDDEEAIRKSISFTLRTSGHQVRTWPSGIAFLKDARHLPPGCVLLDMHMADMGGLEVQADMAARGIRMPVIVITGRCTVNTAVRTMKLGAVSLLEKPFERNALLNAINDALDQVSQPVRDKDAVAAAKLRLACLTPRELDVLNGLADGLPNKAIARDLDISARTVEVHRAHLMVKLGVINFPEALRIAFAARLGEQRARH